MKKIEDFLDEVMSKSARMKKSRLMKTKGKQIARKREIAMKRKADPEKLKVRAVKKARELITKKILKDKSKSDLSISGKEALEKKLSKKTAVIKRIAKKLLPKVKQAEAERIAKLRGKDK
jgi:hypothetical protein